SPLLFRSPGIAPSQPPSPLLSRSPGEKGELRSVSLAIDVQRRVAAPPPDSPPLRGGDQRNGEVLPSFLKSMFCSAHDRRCGRPAFCLVHDACLDFCAPSF